MNLFDRLHSAYPFQSLSFWHFGSVYIIHIDENCMQQAKNHHMLLIFWSWLAFLFSVLFKPRLYRYCWLNRSSFRPLFISRFLSIPCILLFPSFLLLFKSVCLVWIWTVELCRCLVCFGTFWTDSFIREHFKLL